MADYNQNIKVNADTKSAERELSKLDKILKGLSTYVIDPGKGAAQAGVKLAQRNLQDYGRTLATIDRQLGGFGKRLGDIAKAFDFAGKTAVGIGGINALGTALSALPKFVTRGSSALQSFGGILEGLTTPATKVAAALASLGPQGLAAAGGIAAATAAFMAFSPAVRKVVTGLDNLVLGGKIQSAFGGMKGKVEETKQSFLGLNTTIETTVKTLNELAEGMSLRQLNSQVSSLTEEMESFHSSTQQAWDAAQGLVRAQKAQVVEQRALNDLVRQAKGLQPQDVRDAELYGRRNAVQSGRFQQNAAREAAADAKKLADELWEANKAWYAFEAAGKSAFAEEITKAAQATRELEGALSRKARGGDPKPFDAGGVVRRPISGVAYPNGAGPAASPTATEGSVQNLVRREAAARLTAVQQVAAAEMAAAKLLADYEMDVLQQELVAEVNNIERITQAKLKANKLEQADWDKRFKERTTKERSAPRDRNGFGAKLEGVAIGGAFPLLFGAGPGAVVGGALGGLNTGNPIFSVFTSAIGQMLDQFAAAAQDTGKALRDPITNFQKIADAGLLASKSQETYIKRLIEVGRITEATAIIQGEMVKKVGVEGTNDLTRLGETSDRLAKVWAEMNLQMQAAIAGPLADLLAWITAVVAAGNNRREVGAKVEDVRNGLTGKARQEFDRREQDILRQWNVNRPGGISADEVSQRRAALAQEFAGRSTPQQLKATAISPEARQTAADAQLQAAERAEALRRQGTQLERQTQDLRFQVEDQVYGFRQRAADLERANIDLRRSIEDEIFRKRQDITRIEADNARQQAQLAIERLDMQLAGGRASGNAPGQDLANSLLDAVRQYVKTRAEGEADLQLKERLHTVEMEELKRASEKFRFDVARKVADLERQSTELTRDVERAKITTARAIYDLQVAGADYQLAKSKEALTLMADPAQQLAGTQALTGQLKGIGRPVEYLTGDRSSSGYRADHGGGNYHEHIAYATAKEARAAAELLNKNGIKTTELKGVNSVGRHASGSYHYSGQAFDVPGAQVPVGQEQALSRRVRQLLGIGTPGAQAGLASATPRPGLPASLGQATSALGGIKLPGTADVSGLMASMAQLDQKLLSAKTNAMELAKAFSQMSKEQAAQNLSQSVIQITDQLNAPLDQLLKTQRDQLAYEREYAGLIETGVNPALAEQLSKIREQVRLQLEQLDTAVVQLEATKAKLETEGKWTEELQKQLDLLKAQKGVIESKGQEAEGFAARDQKGKKIRDHMTRLRGEVNDTEAMIISLAGTIEGEIGGAMSNAITGVINGTMTVQQAMSQMFANIGAAFIEMATQMIAKALIMKVLGIFGGGISGGGFSANNYSGTFGGGSSLGFNPGSFGGGMSFFADGGFVTGPTQAVVGEGGESEYVIPSSKMGAAMSRYNAGARGGSVIPSSSAGGGGESYGGGSGSFTLETVVINNVEYATVEQVRAMGRQSAQQGAAAGHSKVFGDLRNSRSQRARIGMR